MSTVKNKDFIEIDYTGSVKEEGTVFDTTIKADADIAGMKQPEGGFKPATICIGENQVIKGLDEALVGKEIGKEFFIDIPPEKGFGKKSAKLLRMIPQRIFKKNDINPAPGLQVQIDGQFGIVKTASGGRCIVDFNNPLSGKDLIYKINIKKVVTDIKTKVEAIIGPVLAGAKVEEKEGKVNITFPMEIPAEIKGPFTERIKGMIPEVKDIAFVVEKPKEDKKNITTPK